MFTFSMPLSLRASGSQFGGGVTCVVPLVHLGSVTFAPQKAFLQALVVSQSFCVQSLTGGGGLLTTTGAHLSLATSSAASAPPAVRASPTSLAILSHSSLSFIARALSR